MMNVLYTVPTPVNHCPSVLPNDWLVPAEPYAVLDDGQGGVIQSDLDPAHVRPLSTFEVGADVFVKSPDPTDTLYDTTEQDEADTHIWWRATIVAV